MTKPNHPTPQPSGRTAEEILAELYESGYDLGDGFGGGNKSNVKIAQRQLFDAMMEIVGKCPRHDSPEGIYLCDKCEIQQRLRVFFNQPEASGKDGGK